MINTIASCLACWFWSDTPPPPPPQFHAALLHRIDVNNPRTIRVCCLDNTIQRPLYYFKFENFAPHATIKVPDLACFTYESALVETDCKGNALVMAFVKPNAEVPIILDMRFVVNAEEVGVVFKTKDQE